jgi:ankyrin repeat protein
MEAVKCNDLKKTMSLLQQPMSKVNDRGEGGRTVLHMATAEGNINMVKMLLKYGAQVNLASEVSSQP